MAANPTTRPVVVIPRHVWDAVNNAIQTSSIDGRERPISLCYVAVRAAIAAYVSVEAPSPVDDPELCVTEACSLGDHKNCPDPSANCCECSCHWRAA